jgi:small subunit ribosomal protein S15
MALKKEVKEKLIDKFKLKTGDTGSPSVQISIFTERINGLTEHFKNNPKDHGSRHGLFKLVGHRRQLLSYLKKNDLKAYQDLILKLNLRK